MPDRHDHGGQGRRCPRHRCRRLPGVAGAHLRAGRGQPARAQQPELLPGASRPRHVPRRRPKHSPGVPHPRPVAGRGAHRPLRHRPPSGPGPAGGLPARTPGRARPAACATSPTRLGRLFWKDLELHHPGIEDLRLTPAVAAAWKQRVQVVTTKRGTRPRAGALNCLTVVRAFYLDIAHWATEDPARWGPWVVPCPIRLEEKNLDAKERQHRKSRMDFSAPANRCRAPALIATVDQRRRETAGTAGALLSKPPRARSSPAEARTAAPLGHDPSRGRPGSGPMTRKPGNAETSPWEEHRGFWTWATVEVLRATGLRIEELTELSHHSFVQYTLPSTGELIPLLHIAPSKTDTERLLVISPEVADVLSAIVSRIRDSGGAVPLVADYDRHERVWNPPAPLLFQRRLRVRTGRSPRAPSAAARRCPRPVRHHRDKRPAPGLPSPRPEKALHHQRRHRTACRRTSPSSWSGTRT